MYTTILLKSFRMRKARYILPVIALVIGISVGSAFLMVSLGIQEKVETQLRQFGPNMVVVPHSEDIQLTVGGMNLGSIAETKYIPESDAKKLRDLPMSAYSNKVKGILGKNAFLYSVVKADGKQDVIVAGTWFDQLKNISTWWEVDGNYPTDNESVVLGMTVAEKLGKKVGDTVLLEYNEVLTNETGRYNFTASKSFKVAGIAMTGLSSDSLSFNVLNTVVKTKDGSVMTKDYSPPIPVQYFYANDTIKYGEKGPVGYEEFQGFARKDYNTATINVAGASAVIAGKDIVVSPKDGGIEFQIRGFYAYMPDGTVKSYKLTTPVKSVMGMDRQPMTVAVTPELRAAMLDAFKGGAKFPANAAPVKIKDIDAKMK